MYPKWNRGVTRAHWTFFCHFIQWRGSRNVFADFFATLYSGSRNILHKCRILRIPFFDISGRYLGASNNICSNIRPFGAYTQRTFGWSSWTFACPTQTSNALQVYKCFTLTSNNLWKPPVKKPRFYCSWSMFFFIILVRLLHRKSKWNIVLFKKFLIFI